MGVQNLAGAVIGPLPTGDEAAIDSWFAGLGAETRYARFLSWLNVLDGRTRSELAQVDHIDREAIAAFAPDGSVVGIARYIRASEPRTAEVAVAVADEWNGRGIATQLLARLAERAREAGIEEFIALCLTTNDAVIRLLCRLGPTAIAPSQAGTVELRIAIQDRRGAQAQ